MRITSMPALITPLAGQLTGFVITVGVEYGLWRLAGGDQGSPSSQLIFLLVGLVIALGISFIVRSWIGSLISSQAFEKKVEQNHRQLEILENRLKAVFELNQTLVDAQSEKELIEKSLEVIAKTNSAIGSSFIPFDEWGVALPPYTFGSFPPAVLRAWAEHLNSPAVREKCVDCTRLDAIGGNICQILGAPFVNESIQIYCLPLERSGRMIGMLNLYYPATQVISKDQHDFTNSLLQEMALSVEMLRLHNQELTTLQQIKLAAGSGGDLKNNIQRLVKGLRKAIDYVGAIVEVKSDQARFPGLHLVLGKDPWIESVVAKELISKIISGLVDRNGSRADVQYIDKPGTVVSVPLVLSSGVVIGTMLLTADPETLVHRQQLALIETVASEIALLVETERGLLDDKYRIIMQERTRLAREIHDSLAQTLAYLKLSAAQMQSQLAHGDLTRLEQTLSQSYQALSEAYLETREVIDNLRLIPQNSIADLLKQMAEEFEKTSGLKVETGFPSNVPAISPEVQAQLMRVVQEALSNVRKHSSAKIVKLSISIWNRQLLLEISDDGVGFDAEDVPGLSRYGLQGMRERAELIGADFQIISQAGKGTRIRVQIPVTFEEKMV
jgi:two-component system nitrate/nitrite sensor histidine kinase NarX